MTPLVIRLTRISPTHHTFAYVGANGTEHALKLETKTYLFHDLLHFAVESEAKLAQSFYGRLAQGKSYEELTSIEDPDVLTENSIVERVVGALTGYFKDPKDPEEFVRRVVHFLETSEYKAPVWINESFVMAVQERMRRLQGEWNKLPFGQTMTLTFSV